MTTAASGKKRPEPSAWAEVLAKGVDGWSDFSDTDDEGDGADAEEGAPSPGPFPRPRAGTSGDLASKAANSSPGGARTSRTSEPGDPDPAKLAKEPARGVGRGVEAVPPGRGVAVPLGPALRAAPRAREGALEEMQRPRRSDDRRSRPPKSPRPGMI